MIGNDCICRLQNIYKAINNFEIEMQKATGLNLNEAMTLCLLNSGRGELMSGEIADRLSLTRSNASKVIAILEEERLIRRHVCSQDSRCQKFSITKKGRDKLQETCEKLTIPEELKEL